METTDLEYATFSLNDFGEPWEFQVGKLKVE